MAEEIRKDQAAVRSFRITDDVMSKFNAIKDEMGLNQDGAMGLLIRGYELAKAKEAIPDRETEIANFQLKAQELVDAFLHSLQLNQDAEARIRAEFQSALDMKDKTIANYQAQLEVAVQKAADLAEAQLQLIEAQHQAADAKAKLEAKDEEMAVLTEQHKKQLADKSDINTMLTEKLAAAEQKAKDFPALQADRDALAVALKAAQAEAKDKDREHEVALERASRAAERAQEQALAEAKAEARKEIKEAQDALLATTRELQQAERDHAKEIRAMEQENARLREQLAELRAQAK